MVGRVDMLEIVDAIDHWKAQGIDLSPILTTAKKLNAVADVYCTKLQDHGLDDVLDNKLIERRSAAICEGKPVREELPIKNTNRTVGTMLSQRDRQELGPERLPDDTIHFKFNGSAGQSFGAWLARGVTLELEGDANDYVGKGLSGGKIIVYPPKRRPSCPQKTSSSVTSSCTAPSGEGLSSAVEPRNDSASAIPAPRPSSKGSGTTDANT